MKELILASSSPRRSELLKQLGLTFRTSVCTVDETPPPGLSPFELVELLAVRKAMAVARMLKDGIVIGADTVVVWQGKVLGKPTGREDAMEMLRHLQGTAHEVYTGVALVDAGSRKVLIEHEKTRVFFRSLDEEEIRRYVATGEPLDKAGGYASTMYTLNGSLESLLGSSKESVSSPKGTGKAGAYAIQGIGALFVEKIEGDYSNVVGLPLCKLGKMLKEFGITII